MTLSSLRFAGVRGDNIMGKPKLAKTREQNIYSYIDSEGTKKYAYRYRYTRSDHKKADAYKQGFKSAKEASLALMTVKTDLLNANYTKVDNADMTVAQLCDIYINFKKHTWKVSTLSKSICILKNICESIGDIKLRNLTKVVYYEEYIAPELQRIKANSVKHHHTVFSGAINFAVEEDLLDKNRISKISIDAKSENYAIKKEELDEILTYANARAPRMRDGVYILAYTGMRVGEVCGLKWKDIDFAKRTISVQRTLDRHGERTPKTRNSIRTLPLPDVLHENLKALKRTREREIFQKTASIDGEALAEEYVLLNSKGNPRVQNDFTRFFKKVRDSIGITCRSHAVRHTYATILIGEGFDIATVAALLGDTIETVQKVYVHAINTHVQAASQHFNNVMQEVAKSDIL